MEKLGQDKGITLSMDTVKGNILGDRARVRQVLLICSIMLCVSPRQTEPSVSVRNRQENSLKWLWLIADPASPQHLPHLFECFYQVRTNATNDSRSNGLGLSIAKGLIEVSMAPSILNTTGKGTHVHLLLPAA